MVYLRSGQTAKDGPEQKYQSASDIFKKETRDEFKKKYPDMQAARDAQKKTWEAFSEKQKEKYNKLYEASIKEYEDSLVLHYGGTKKDVAAAQEIKRIPPKPKHPLNSLFLYLNEHRDEYVRENPGQLGSEVTAELSKRYNALPGKQLKTYQMQAMKEQETYDKEMEKWESLYGKQFNEGQKVLKAQHKYHSQGKKQPLTYQQILSAKEKRKLVPLGDQETKQVDEHRGRPKKQNQQEQKNDRKSTSNPRQSRSPSQNPKLTQEQKDQKNQKPDGRGRQKKA